MDTKSTQTHFVWTLIVTNFFTLFSSGSKSQQKVNQKLPLFKLSFQSLPSSAYSYHGDTMICVCVSWYSCIAFLTQSSCSKSTFCLCYIFTSPKTNKIKTWGKIKLEKVQWTKMDKSLDGLVYYLKHHSCKNDQKLHNLGDLQLCQSL